MNQKQMAGYKAAEYVKDGMLVGLGTGSTAYYVIEKVGEMVKNGLNIKAVSTSDQTTEHAKSLGIPLLSIDEITRLDICIDGVDEVDPEFNGIKGGGAALFREKIVAKTADMNIWVMDDSKLVDKLGAFKLPVEVLPFGYTHVLNRLEADGFKPVLRKKDGEIVVTNNHNYILDIQINDSKTLEQMADYLINIVGVVEHGFFLKHPHVMIVATNEGVKEIKR